MLKNKILWFFIIIIAVVCVSFFVLRSSNKFISEIATNKDHEEGEDKDSKPTDWFIKQRISDKPELNFQAFREAKKQATKLQKKTAFRSQWEFVGPTNIGGRICDVEMDPTNVNIGYFAAASGGIFKTVDQGKTWKPIFDNEMTLNMGDICVSPSNPNILYVGTGEVNPGGGSITYPGLGVFKSIDAGKTWKHLGLEGTQSIGRVKIHPTNPDIVYVAATGRLYGESEERGVYRTVDGGKNWEKVLFVSTKTGCVDLAINPKNPNILYAAMWQRIRKPGYQKYGGPESAIYRSEDAGNTWKKLTNGLPHSDENTGRIGIDICNSQPDVLYTCYSTTSGAHMGVFKTVNNGDTWKRTNADHLNVGSYAWWFSNIRVDPNDPNTVFFLGFHFYRSTSGGNSWDNVGSSMHVDHHGLYIHPLNSNICFAGNDGGVYVSTNAGSRWTKSEDLPITQFYSIAVDPKDPNRILAGAQDNGVNLVSDNTKNGWTGVIGGDGLDVAFDPTDSRYAYGESQYGAFQASSNGGKSFNWSSGSGLSGTKGWKCPIAIDSSNGDVYFGSDRVFRSTDHGYSFSSISPKLTFDSRDPFRTVTSIAIAPSNNKYIYAGTDNGNVWMTKDHGSNWTKVSNGLPSNWITSIDVNPSDPTIAYVAISGYRWDKILPHVFATKDAGKSWDAISNNLPEAPVNQVLVDPIDSNKLYTATDMGVYISLNKGKNWQTLGSGLPHIVIHEIAYHAKTKTLYAATFGRGIYKINITK